VDCQPRNALQPVEPICEEGEPWKKQACSSYLKHKVRVSFTKNPQLVIYLFPSSISAAACVENFRRPRPKWAEACYCFVEGTVS